VPKLPRDEFEALAQQLRDRHGRVTGWNLEDHGALFVRAPTEDDVESFLQVLDSDGVYAAADNLVVACIIHPSGSAADDLLDDVPGIVGAVSDELLDRMGTASREATEEELAPLLERARKLCGWHDDELGLIAFRSPRRVDLKRYEKERKSARRGDKLAAVVQLMRSCALSPSGDELGAVIKRLPALPLAVLPKLKELAGATDAVLGKAHTA